MPAKRYKIYIAHKKWSPNKLPDAINGLHERLQQLYVRAYEQSIWKDAGVLEFTAFGMVAVGQSWDVLIQSAQYDGVVRLDEIKQQTMSGPKFEQLCFEGHNPSGHSFRPRTMDCVMAGDALFRINFEIPDQQRLHMYIGVQPHFECTGTSASLATMVRPNRVKNLQKLVAAVRGDESGLCQSKKFNIITYRGVRPQSQHLPR